MNERRALVVGANGTIARALVAELGDRWRVVVAARDHPDADVRLDLLDGSSVREALTDARPDVVFVAVDGSARVADFEAEPDLCAALFVAGTEAVADVSAGLHARVVLFSTDLVFDGGSGPYREDVSPNPSSHFGRAKAMAEEIVLSLDTGGLVVRSSEVFGWNRTSANLAMEVWRRGRARLPIDAPSSWTTTPTLASELARAAVGLAEAGAEGVYHAAGADRRSRFELATEIGRAVGIEPDLVHDRHRWSPGDGRFNGGLVSEKLTATTGVEPLPVVAAIERFRAELRNASSGVTAHRSADERRLRAEILDKVVEYHALAHSPKRFVPYESRVNYSGRVYGSEELVNLVDASLDFWLTLGPHGAEFERSVRDRFGATDAVLVNSGSTANLSALMTLTSERVKNRLRPGDEVITPAVTFPTTLTPIVHCGLVPVFVDCAIGTYNLDPRLLEDAVSDRTRAIVIPHTLGNPCDMRTIMDVAERYELIVVEDACDAFGARFDGRPVGTFGSMATLSFYPAHHITMGEGGAVIVNRPGLGRIVRSVRDWGRDCWCAPGKSDTCGRRFGWQLGELPYGYDHKYVYSTFGYNFKPTDMQAAIGLAQLDRLDDFLARRQRNFDLLYEGLRRYEDALVLPVAEAGAEPAWFGFPVTVNPPFERRDLVQWLEANNIETRQVFGGNITRQPAFTGIRHRLAGTLANSDRVMRDTFFIGVYPGLTEEMVAFVLEQFDRFFAGRIAGSVARG